MVIFWVLMIIIGMPLIIGYLFDLGKPYPEQFPTEKPYTDEELEKMKEE